MASFLESAEGQPEGGGPTAAWSGANPAASTGGGQREIRACAPSTLAAALAALPFFLGPGFQAGASPSSPSSLSSSSASDLPPGSSNRSRAVRMPGSSSPCVRQQLIVGTGGRSGCRGFWPGGSFSLLPDATLGLFSRARRCLVSYNIPRRTSSHRCPMPHSPCTTGQTGSTPSPQ